jgi:hypothetical protein
VLQQRPVDSFFVWLERIGEESVVNVGAHNGIVKSKIRLERIGPLSALIDLSVRDFD